MSCKNTIVLILTSCVWFAVATAAVTARTTLEQNEGFTDIPKKTSERVQHATRFVPSFVPSGTIQRPRCPTTYEENFFNGSLLIEIEYIRVPENGEKKKKMNVGKAKVPISKLNDEPCFRVWWFEQNTKISNGRRMFWVSHHVVDMVPCNYVHLPQGPLCKNVRRFIGCVSGRVRSCAESTAFECAQRVVTGCAKERDVSDGKLASLP